MQMATKNHSLAHPAGSAAPPPVDVTRLGSQRVQHLFTQLRKVAQHPLLIRARYNEDQVGLPLVCALALTYIVLDDRPICCVLAHRRVQPCIRWAGLGYTEEQVRGKGVRAAVVLPCRPGTNCYRIHFPPQLREMAHIAATRDLFGGSPTVERCLQELTSYSDHQLHIFSGEAFQTES